MARSNFRIEQGIEIHDANGTGSSYILRGSGAPLGTSGPTDDAAIGSIYLRTDAEGELYRKEASSSQASDWKRMVDESVYSALGIAFDDENFGAYTGGILTDNSDAKTNIQELSDAIEAISGGSSSEDNVGAGTPTTVNTCLVDDCNGVEYEVIVYEQGDETKKEFFKLTSLHNGTSSADASAFDESVHTKLKNTGSDVAGLSFTTKLTGTGASQTIGLEISATAAITVKTRRTNL